jgi:SAM-dependent methyltransferase
MGRWQRAVSRWIRRFQGWSAMRSAPMEALNGLSAGRALDVGCGRGDLASTLATRGWKMTGIDPSPAACAAARARGIDARCGTLSTVPLEPAAFGAAIFHHSLEHVHDPVAALRAVAAALAPAGLVLITVPNFECWQARRFAGYWYHLDLPRHRVHFTRAALQRALLSAGLEVVAFSTSTTAVGLPASIQYRVLDRCLFPSGLGLRIASGWCAVMLPVAALLDRAFGAGDVLHVVARLSPARTEMASSSTSDIRRAGPG